MKEKSSPCETSAVRIQYWLKDDKKTLLHLVPKSQDFCKKYTCDLIKPPRIPSQVKHLPLQGYAFSRQGKQTKTHCITKDNPSKPLRVTVSSSHCSTSQKYGYYLTPENSLSSGRVAYSKLKEHLLVSKRLKSISKEHTVGPKKHQVVSIKSSTQKDLSQDPYIQEWEKSKEERHFQMGYIKYLS